MTAAERCLGCSARAVRRLLDFGPQPPSNRFESVGTAQPDRHPLVVGQCRACGLVQLVDPMPPAMAKSRFAWLTYNEPEGHLDDLVGRLRALPGFGPGSRIVGVTYKDDSTLARLNRLGFADTYRLDAASDLGLHDPCAGLESIQAALDGAAAARLAAKHGPADMLLVRHALEHAHDPAGFLRALTALVKPGGHLVFEVPDSGKFLEACDYSFIWEEHVAYFTPQTLAAFLGGSGVTVRETVLYPYPLENSLIAVVANENPPERRPSPPAEVKAALEIGRTYARRHAEVGGRLQGLLAGWRAEGKRIAIFGAGHLAAKFVNLLPLGGLVDCVIDDNPRKQSYLMPGSRLPILGSAELPSVAVCLLSLNPESEQKVLAKYQGYIDRGGRFLSIFALSPRSVRRMIPA